MKACLYLFSLMYADDGVASFTTWYETVHRARKTLLLRATMSSTFMVV